MPKLQHVSVGFDHFVRITWPQEHEAWNRSPAERVVLIFEAHRPDLRPEERAAIEHAFEARGRWLRERRIPT